MRIEREIRYELSIEQAYAMVSSARYQERKCADAGALSYDVTVTERADGAHIVARRAMPTTDFPALLRKIAPSEVTSTETISWGAAAGDGSRTGALTVEFQGVPVSMAGAIDLLAQGPAAVLVTIRAELEAHVPLLGRRVESATAPIIHGVIDAEQATGLAWVSGVR